MSKSVKHTQSNFNGGEWSPRMHGRSDFAKYSIAADEIENFVVDGEGSLTRRSGTHYMASTKNDGEAKLLPFKFSEVQSYVIEFGELYVRFFRDQAVLGAPYEVVSPYTFLQVEDLVFTQSADILYLCHHDVKPQQLNRLADLNWTFTDFDFQDGPYDAVNTTATTISLSGITGSVTATFSSVVGINGGAGFTSSDIGRLIRHKDGTAEWSWLEITAITSTTVVTALIRGQDIPNTPAHINWRLGAWSDTDGWPSSVAFHQGRLWFAGSNANPNTIWSSVTGDFTNFQPSAIDGVVADDDAVTISIADEVNLIRWMHSASKGLMVGSQGGEHIVAARSSLDPITPSSVASSRQSSIGSTATVGVVPVAQSLLFVGRGAKKMHELIFRFSEDQYVGPDLTLFADHLSSQKMIKQITFQQEHDHLIWVVYDDGTLAAMTHMRDHEITGWHRHIIGSSSADESAFVESITSVPSSDHDVLHMIVKRTINGVVRRYVEYVQDRFHLDQEIATSCFLDSNLKYSGSPITTVTQLDHLEGETVGVLADGAVRPNAIVSGGEVTIAEPAASEIHVGLPYSSKFKSLPIVLASVAGGGISEYKTGSDIFILFFQTVGAKAGFEGSAELETIIFRNPSDPMGQAVPLFSGIKKVSASSGQQRELQVRIEQDQPLPMSILQVTSEVKIDES